MKTNWFKIAFLIVVLLMSCDKNSKGYYLEIHHKVGSKFIHRIVHSNINCDNINGPVRKLGLDIYIEKDFSYSGFCHKCMSDKQAEEFVSWSDILMYQDKANKGFEGVYKLSRHYFSGSDTIERLKFIEVVFINNQSNICYVYDYIKNIRPLKDIPYNLKNDYDNSKFLFDMEKEYFLVRIKRWAEEYLTGEIHALSEESQKDLDELDIQLHELDND